MDVCFLIKAGMMENDWVDDPVPPALTSRYILSWCRLRAWGRGALPSPAEVCGEAEVRGDGQKFREEGGGSEQKSVRKIKRRLDFRGPSQPTLVDESLSFTHVSGVRGNKPPHCSVCRHVTSGESGKRKHHEGGCGPCGTTTGCHVAHKRSRKRGREERLPHAEEEAEGEGEGVCSCGWCREVGWGGEEDTCE